LPICCATCCSNEWPTRRAQSPPTDESKKAAENLPRLFEDRVTLVKSWRIGRFRRYYATGRLQDHYEIKFDDGDLADIPLPPEDYGDANMEDGWVLIDEAEI